MCQSDFEHYSKLTLNKQLMNLPEMIENCYKIIHEPIQSKKVCIFALGDSEISGDLFSSLSDTYFDTPIHVITNGDIPKWVSYDTTSILISYSGYNDIINRIYEELLIRNSTIICITSGGKLMNNCSSNNNILYKLPPNLTSRMAIGLEIGIISSIISGMKIYDVNKLIEESLPFVKEFRDMLVKGKIVEQKTIDALKGKSVSVYGISELCATYKRWKTSFNADAMCHAFCSDLPEFDHNELVGWANHKQPTDDIVMIVLKCETDPVLSKIIDSMIDVLKEHNRNVIEFNIPGTNTVEKNLCGILMGDYISQKLSSRNNLVRRLSE